MTIRTKLFIGFATLVIAFGIVSAFLGVKVIQDRVIQEAQTRVRSDLNSARSVMNAELHNIETILKLAAGAPAIIDACLAATESYQDAQNRMELIRMEFGLDFLTLISAKGQVILRATPPHKTGDFRLSNAVILKALKGETAAAIELMSAEEMASEHQGLAEQAFLVFEETPRARLSPRTEETRGMVLMGAVPIEKGNQLVGVIYGGNLLNRNYATVDRVTDIVFRHERTDPSPTGTVTIFLYDTRIATTVRLANGNRAIGTRASKEVADRVLDNGQRWEGRAFVVNDWYLTAYDPIWDYQGRVIGMLYVGILEKPFNDLIKDTILNYVLLSFVGVAVALILAFFLAGRLAYPLHQLAESAISLKNVNQSYMEALGFISHKLKSPLSTILNYVFLIREQKLGILTEKQAEAITNVDRNVRLIIEMVRHYLNLSLIERGKLEPVRGRVELLKEVLTPLLESFQTAAKKRKITTRHTVTEDVVLHADLDMTREVFENLISNAIKYGREGGIINIAAQPAGDMIRFSVFNEGDGIPPDKLPALFQKFSRLEENKATQKQKDTRLGLFICKHIIEAHEGEIHVESRPGEGVEFVFTLPRYHEDVNTSET